MWAVGRYDLKLSEEEFWNLTFVEYYLLVKQFRLEQDRADLRTAQIACILAEVNRDHKKRPQSFEVADFMPGRAKKKVKEGKPQSIETMKAMAMAVTRALGGKIIQKKC